MPGFEVCVCYLVRSAPDGSTEVLLGRKKTGLGSGKSVGLGGKLEPGESAQEAIVREVFEESGVRLTPGDLIYRGRLEYSFPFRESWTQSSTVFVAEDFIGEPIETEEIEPHWYPVDALPLGLMWDDAGHWLPQVLAGRTVTAWFEFGPDCETVSDSRVDFEESL